MVHKPKTLDDIRTQRKRLKRKIKETEAILAGQLQLGSEKLLPNLDSGITNLPYIAKFLHLIALIRKQLNQLQNLTKPPQPDKRDQEALWTELLKVTFPLLVGLLTKRFSK